MSGSEHAARHVGGEVAGLKEILVIVIIIIVVILILLLLLIIIMIARVIISTRAAWPLTPVMMSPSQCSPINNRQLIVIS